MTTIHDDLVFQILIWLPLASLSRCKSVCKSWFSMIQTSHFINQHRLRLHVQTPNSEDNLLIKTYDFNQGSYVFSILSGENYHVSHDISDNPISSHLHHVMVASCNGIVCQTDENSKVVSLWNPTTKQYKLLPESCLGQSSSDLDCRIQYGFFYDSETDDFKVIRFFFNIRGHLTEIYNLSTDSWRDITCKLPIGRIKSDPRVPYRNKTYCWLGVVDNEEFGVIYGAFVILTFDINKDEFGTIPLPSTFDIMNQTLGTAFEFVISNPCGWDVLKLAIIRDEILFIIWPCQTLEKQDIWVLNDYGVEPFWTKLYILQLAPRIECSIRWIGTSRNGIIFLTHDKCMRGSGNRFCHGEEGNKLLLYNTVTQETSILPILEPSFPPEVVQYERSLVSVESIKGANSNVLSVKQSQPKTCS